MKKGITSVITAIIITLLASCNDDLEYPDDYKTSIRTGVAFKQIWFLDLSDEGENDIFDIKGFTNETFVIGADSLRYYTDYQGTPWRIKPGGKIRNLSIYTETYAAGGTEDGYLFYCNLGVQLKKKVKPDSIAILSVALNPEGNKCLAGGYLGDIYVYNVSGDTLANNFTKKFPYNSSHPKQHSRTISSLVFINDTLFVSGSFDSKMLRWSITCPGDTAYNEIGSSENRHKDYIRSICRNPYPIYSNRILSGSNDKKAKYWNLGSPSTLEWTFDNSNSAWGYISSVAISSTGTQAIIGSDDGTAILLNDIHNEGNFYLANTYSGFNFCVQSVSFIVYDDKQYVLIGTSDGYIRCYQAF